MSVLYFYVRVDRIVVQHVLRQRRPAAPLVGQLLLPVLAGQPFVLRRLRDQAVIDGIEGLVIGRPQPVGADGSRVGGVDHFERFVVHR